MKKSLLFAFALTSFMPLAANAWGEDKCNPEPECYGCAYNKPETLVQLEPCAYKDKPYNYYTWQKVAEKQVPSDRYDWSASADEAYY